MTMSLMVLLMAGVAPASSTAPAPPTPAPSAEAGKLFDKARAAFKANNFAEACPAFEQSYVLEPALGTLLNLGACLEKQGRFASAWIRYNDAVSWALRTHEVDREEFARKLSNAVKPKVSWLAVSASEDVDLKLDTQTVRVTPTPISLPIDPGLHALVAEKPGYEKWSANVEIVQPGTTNTQKIPQLKPLTLSAVTPPPPPMPVAEVKMEPTPWTAPPAPPIDLTPSPDLSVAKKAPAAGSTRGAGIALIVTGSLVTVAGAVGLGWSSATYSALQAQRINVLPPASYVSKADYEAIKWVYPASWVGVGVGAAAIITGAVLAAKKPAAVTLSPSVGPNGAAMTLSGQF